MSRHHEAARVALEPVGVDGLTVSPVMPPRTSRVSGNRSSLVIGWTALLATCTVTASEDPPRTQRPPRWGPLCVVRLQVQYGPEPPPVLAHVRTAAGRTQRGNLGQHRPFGHAQPRLV